MADRPFLWARLCFYCYQDWLAIEASTSSTAAIGFIYLPFMAAIAAVPFAGVGYAAGAVIRALQTRRQRHVVIASLTAVLAVPYLLYVAWTQVNDGELAMTIAHIEKLDDSGLAAFLTEGKFRSNTYALAAVALNPAASTATLARIAAMDIPALHRKFGGRRELMGKTARASQ
jgi:hypothetical protein